jgi:toxin-antitoxin system PIN domain toxin
VIAVDTNILVYAHREDSTWYQRADACLTRLMESRLPWAVPWPCLHEFLGIVTHSRVYVPPTPPDLAIGQMALWLEAPKIVLLGIASGYWPILRAILEQSQATGPRVHDAHIAALCRNHGVSELWTADRDFRRFRGLKVVNPLIDA